jgi:metal transporter CNNM
VTLFLFNAVANEALPIFLSGLVPEYAAVILATFSVLIFGEILPSSIFSGPKQLQIASNLAGVVNILLFVFYIVARPIGLFLDWWLGKHDEEGEAPFNAKDLYTLLSLSRVKPKKTEGDVEAGSENPLAHSNSEQRGSVLAEDYDHTAPPVLHHQNSSENLLGHDSVLIAQGAIMCSRLGVETIMQPSFHTVSSDEQVDIQWFESVGRCGFSRVLVQEEGAIIGYIMVKDLLCNLGTYLGQSPTSSKQTYLVRDLPRHHVEYFKVGTSVLDALNVLQDGSSRLGAVTSTGDAEGDVVGYFSMEDVLEEIIQEEISDEKDFRRTAMQIIKADRIPSSKNAY